MSEWQPTEADREILRVAWDRLLELGVAEAGLVSEWADKWSPVIAAALARHRRLLAEVYIADPAIAALLAQLTPIPPKCEKCHGAGWYPESTGDTDDPYNYDYNERYCDCASGDVRRVRDGAEPRAVTPTSPQP